MVIDMNSKEFDVFYIVDGEYRCVENMSSRQALELHECIKEDYFPFISWKMVLVPPIDIADWILNSVP